MFSVQIMVASNMEIIHPIAIASPKTSNSNSQQTFEVESQESTGQDDKEGNNKNKSETHK